HYGAGTILNVTANPPPSGTLFAGWLGAGISNASSASTLFTMPTNATTVTALYTNVPAPIVNGGQVHGGTNRSLTAQTYPSQPWVLQTSLDLVTWVNALTNYSD